MPRCCGSACRRCPAGSWPSRTHFSARMINTARMLTALVAASLIAQFDPNQLKKAAEEAGRGAAQKAGSAELEKRVNEKLLDDSRKNQCAFKSGSDEFEGSCQDKLDNLYSSLIDAKKKVNDAGFSGFKFEVSGHTD